LAGRPNDVIDSANRLFVISLIQSRFFIQAPGEDKLATKRIIDLAILRFKAAETALHPGQPANLPACQPAEEFTTYHPVYDTGS